MPGFAKKYWIRHLEMVSIFCSMVMGKRHELLYFL